MPFRRTFLSLVLASATLLSQAHAHGLWTEQRRGQIEVVYGHGAEDDAFKAQKISGAWAYDAAGRQIPVNVERLADHARLQPLKSPAVVAVAMDNGMWSQTPEQKWINQGRRQVPNATRATQTFKYSLAIYQANAKLPTLEKLRLVIIPLADPLTVGPGKPLPVQVLLDGQPAAGVALIGDYRSNPDQVSATTDSTGKAQVVVRNDALNIIAAKATQKAANDPDVDERGFFTSLSFLGQPHHE